MTDPGRLNRLRSLFPLRPELVKAQLIRSTITQMSTALAEEIRDIPEIMDNARALAKVFEGLNDGIDAETALRAAVMQFIANIPLDPGPKMGLLVRLLEAGLCMIEWSVVAEITGLASPSSSTRSTDSPPDGSGGTPTC